MRPIQTRLTSETVYDVFMEIADLCNCERWKMRSVINETAIIYFRDSERVKLNRWNWLKSNLGTPIDYSQTIESGQLAVLACFVMQERYNTKEEEGLIPIVDFDAMVHRKAKVPLLNIGAYADIEVSEDWGKLAKDVQRVKNEQRHVV